MNHIPFSYIYSYIFFIILWVGNLGIPFLVNVTTNLNYFIVGS